MSMMTLVNEQKDMAEALSSSLESLGFDVEVTALLDGLASEGIQLAPCVGENIPSLAFMSLLGMPDHRIEEGV